MTLADVGIHSRAGTSGSRPRGGIGFAVVRGGDIVGEHSAVFAGTGETLEIRHRASDRNPKARDDCGHDACRSGDPVAKQ